MLWGGINIIVVDAAAGSQQLDIAVVTMSGITGIAADGPGGREAPACRQFDAAMSCFSTGYIETIAVLKNDILFCGPINAQIIRQRIDGAADTELNTLGFF